MQRQMIVDQFGGKGWRIAELLEKVEQSGNFYFDKFYQIKMPCWSKGRVALVGGAKQGCFEVQSHAGPLG